jgi:hypothetical protein
VRTPPLDPPSEHADEANASSRPGLSRIPADQRRAATAAKNDWCSSCARAADATETDWVATTHKNQVPATRPKPDAVGLLSVDATVQPTVTCPSMTNGAGKTTTIEILEGFRRRSAGRVAVLGVDSEQGDEHVKYVLPDQGWGEPGVSAISVSPRRERSTKCPAAHPITNVHTMVARKIFARGHAAAC